MNILMVIVFVISFVGAAFAALVGLGSAWGDGYEDRVPDKRLIPAESRVVVPVRRRR